MTRATRMRLAPFYACFCVCNGALKRQLPEALVPSRGRNRQPKAELMEPGGAAGTHRELSRQNLASRQQGHTDGAEQGGGGTRSPAQGCSMRKENQG
jgi:hypothetical protein